ncbi:unnamed protein product [Chrysoparadoxa australica]
MAWEAEISLIEEQLKSRASHTIKHLSTIWDEVGMPEEDRIKSIHLILDGFTELCAQKEIDEEVFRDGLQEQIHSLQEEIHQMARQLGDDAPVAVDNQPKDLTDQLISLQTQAECLRARHDEAREKFVMIQEFLVKTGAAVGEVVGSELLGLEGLGALTDKRYAMLQAKKQELEDTKEERTACVSQLLTACHQLMKDLNVTLETKPQTVLSELDQVILRSSVAKADQGDGLGDACVDAVTVGFTPDSLEKLTKRREELREECAAQKERVECIAGEVAVLWDQLGTPDEKRSEYKTQMEEMETTSAKVALGEGELSRLKQRRADMLPVLVGKARARLSHLLQETCATKEEKDKFLLVERDGEGTLTLETLDELLKEEERLAIKLEGMLPIIAKYKERSELAEEWMMHTMTEKNPARLQSRSAADRQELKAELAREKRIRKLPNLTENLKRLIMAWETSNGCTFEIDGRSAMEAIEANEREHGELKVSLKSSKAKGKWKAKGEGQRDGNAKGKGWKGQGNKENSTTTTTRRTQAAASK